MLYPFTARVALVTGAASGIGRTSALAFAQSGAKVVVADFNEAGGQETVDMIRAADGEALFVRTDVTQQVEVSALLKTVFETYGQLDFALNNAGIGGIRASTADYPVDLWHQIMDVNLNGVWYCMKYEIPRMVEQGHGVIINLASIAGLIGSPYLSAYAASKHAVVGLTKTAALEYVRKGLRINAVCPAYTDTPMVDDLFEKNPEHKQQLLAAIPSRRLGTTEEIASAILYLCSDQAAFITGHTMVLDGGITAG